MTVNPKTNLPSTAILFPFSQISWTLSRSVLVAFGRRVPWTGTDSSKNAGGLFRNPHYSGCRRLRKTILLPLLCQLASFLSQHPACVDGEDSRTDGRTDGMPTASFVYLFPPQPQPPTSFFGEFVCVCASVSSGVLLSVSRCPIPPAHSECTNVVETVKRWREREREKRESGGLGRGERHSECELWGKGGGRRESGDKVGRAWTEGGRERDNLRMRKGGRGR